MESKEDDSELLANIKRLTVRVLDDLDEGSKNRTLDDQQKRLLSATGARLLRLWRMVEREGRSKKALEEVERVGGLSNETSKTDQESMTR